MSKKSSEIQEIIWLLERIIDVRFEYNQEKSMENIHYARRILDEEYNPLAEKLSLLIQKMLDDKA